jgi:hypothetical protein
VQLERLDKLKKKLFTSSGLEPATFQRVAYKLTDITERMGRNLNVINGFETIESLESLGVNTF